MSVAVLVMGQVQVVETTGQAAALAEGRPVVFTAPAGVVLDVDGRRTRCALFPGDTPLQLDAGKALGFSGEGIACAETAGQTVCRTGYGDVRAVCTSRLAPLDVARPEEAARHRVFVQAFTAGADSAEPARVLTDLAAANLDGAGPFDVVTSADVAELLDNEARKQALGCDQAGCLAELAGMLGADFIVSGHVAPGERRALVVDIRLIAAEDGRGVGEVNFVNRDLTTAAVRLNLALDVLTAELTGTKAPAVPPPYLGRTAVSGSTLVGAGALGGAALLAAGGLLSTTAGLYFVTPKVPVLPVHQSAFWMLAGVALMPGVAAACALVVDLASGATPDWRRALLVAVATFVVTLPAIGFATFVGLNTPFAYLVAQGRTSISEAEARALSQSPLGLGLVVGGFFAAGVPAVAASAALTAGAYIGAVELLPDEPWGEGAE